MKKDKRLRIIQAAASIFSRDGLEKARVEDIAKLAKIGKGTIYLYFPSKEAILEEGIRFFAVKRIDELKMLLSKYKSPLDKLTTLLNLSIKISQKDPEIFFMNYAALLSTHKDLRQRAVSEFFTRYVELVRGILDEGIVKGVFRKLDPNVVALAIVLTQDLGNLLLMKGEYKVKSGVVAKELIELIKR